MRFNADIREIEVEIFREFVESYLKYTLAWLECERDLKRDIFKPW